VIASVASEARSDVEEASVRDRVFIVKSSIPGKDLPAQAAVTVYVSLLPTRYLLFFISHRLEHSVKCTPSLTPPLNVLCALVWSYESLFSSFEQYFIPICLLWLGMKGISWSL
jgi:hypothetical protein